MTSGPGRWDGRTGPELAALWSVPLVEAHESIGSTNDRASELARSGAARGSVVVAEEQTAGRGRRGSRWQSGAGAGLWMSVVLDPEDARAHLPLLVGVACAEAIEAITGQPSAGGAGDRDAFRVAVKWPNDLLVEGRKVGGILCEAAPAGVVVGVGINVAVPAGGFAAELAGSAVALEMMYRKPLRRSELAGAITRRLLERLQRDGGFGEVRTALEARDALRDRPVVTEQAGAGVARGFDKAGSLVLERPDGSRVPVTAGSVRLT